MCLNHLVTPKEVRELRGYPNTPSGLGRKLTLLNECLLNAGIRVERLKRQALRRPLRISECEVPQPDWLLNGSEGTFCKSLDSGRRGER